MIFFQGHNDADQFNSLQLEKKHNKSSWHYQEFTHHHIFSNQINKTSLLSADFKFLWI